MNFASARSSKGWIVLVATLLGVSFGGYSFISHARANHVYTLTCGIVDYKPSVFFKSCADGGIAVGQIQWESWSQTGARGRGIYAVNDCTPNCAEGNLRKVPVLVKLTGSDPLDIYNGKRILNVIRIATPDKRLLPLSSQFKDSWKLE